MIPAINEWMLAVSSSLAASIVVKVTVITALGLFAGWLARGSRAAVRHALLAAAFAVMLLLPLASVLVPPVHLGVRVAVENRAAAVPTPVSGITETPAVMLAEDPVIPVPASSPISLSHFLLAAWIAGGAIFLLPALIGLWQIRLLRRSGVPWRHGQSLAATIALDAGVHRRVEVLLHEVAPGPMTCGIARPVIVLPQDAENWSEEDLNRAFIHELEHVRRCDSVTRSLARVACAVYWFHPLVWIAWRKLVLQAERSCDDAVLRHSEATAYADQLVGLAQRLSATQRSPLLAMANRADLTTRVRAVLDARQRRGRAGVFSLGLATTAALVLVISMSSLILVAKPQAAPAQTLPPPTFDKPQDKPSHTKSDPPRLMAQAPTPTQPAPAAQAKLEFEVASVRASGPIPRPEDIVAYYNAQPRTSGGPGTPDPERLTITNTPLRRLLYNAYGVRPDQLSGPDWLDEEAFNISAKIPPGTTKEQANAMLQNLLIERFNITLHHITKDLPGYELTVAKNGSKLKEVAPDPTATAPQPGEFLSRRIDPDASGFPVMPEGRIGILAVLGSDHLNRMTCRACSLAELIERIKVDLAVPADSKARSFMAGRIVDKTGLTEKYDFHFEYLGGLVGSALQPPSVDDQTASGPDLFSALEKQLGLKLEKTKVPLDVLVIDSADKIPTDN